MAYYNGKKVLSVVLNNGVGEKLLLNLTDLTDDYSTISQETYDKLMNGIKTGTLVGIYSEYDGTFMYSGIVADDETGSPKDIVFSQRTGDTEASAIFRKDLTIGFKETPLVPSLPSDASSKTYTLKAVNGTLQWVE